ncbi:MAG: DUF4332 domain-containing protein [Candidatus Bathyarchaeia archaeon]
MAKIEEIEGIGPEYAKKLNAVGIKTTDDLLNAEGQRRGGRSLLRKQAFQKSLFLNG